MGGVGKRWLFWLSLGLLVAGVKLAILSADSVPRVFSGDSGFYLYTSLNGAIPYDRSFTYGRVIRRVTGERHEIRHLVVAQVVASTASALLLAAGLRIGFGVSYGLVSVGALLATVEPLQLAYERFVMTETLAGLCYALIVVGGLYYLRHPRPVVLVGLALVGVMLLSLRLNAAAAAAFYPLVLPLLAWRRLSRGERSRRPWLHVGVAVLAVAVTHAGYRHLYGALQSGPPAYSYAGGRFLLGSASPLVRPEDFPDGVAARILPDVKVPFGLPREIRFPLQVRDFHMWAPDGLVTVVQRHSADVLAADALARTIAVRALSRDPGGALRLGTLTLGSYFDPTLARLYDPAALADLLQPELGPPSLPKANELEAYRLGPASLGPSLTRRWHQAAVPYYPLILLCPLLAVVAWLLARGHGRAETAFVGVVALATIATGPLVAASAVIRYLHPLAWMNVLIGVVLAHRVVEASRAVQRGRRTRRVTA